MFQKVLKYVKATLEDRLTDDTILLYQLVDIVQILSLCHAEVAELKPTDKAHQRCLAWVKACLKFAEQPTERNHSKVVFSWMDLDVRKKQELRKVVRMDGVSLRNESLLELTGARVPSERTSVSTVGSEITHMRSTSPRRAKRGKRISL